MWNDENFVRNFNWRGLGESHLAWVAFWKFLTNLLVCKSREMVAVSWSACADKLLSEKVSEWQHQATMRLGYERGITCLLKKVRKCPETELRKVVWNKAQMELWIDVCREPKWGQKLERAQKVTSKNALNEKSGSRRKTRAVCLWIARWFSVQCLCGMRENWTFVRIYAKCNQKTFILSQASRIFVQRLTWNPHCKTFNLPHWSGLFIAHLTQNTHSNAIEIFHFAKSIANFRTALGPKAHYKTFNSAHWFDFSWRAWSRTQNLKLSTRVFFYLSNSYIFKHSSHVRIKIINAFIIFAHPFVMLWTRSAHSKTFFFASSISTFRHKFDFSQIRDQN